MVQWVVGSFLHVVNPLSYFSFQPVLHDWCNKDRGMCYPVCGMVHIKEPLLLIGKSSPCGRSMFPFSLSEWSFTICECLTPYNRKSNVLSVSLNKTCPSFLPTLHQRARCSAVVEHHLKARSNARSILHSDPLSRFSFWVVLHEGRKCFI